METVTRPMAASLANRSHDVPCRLCGGLRRGPQTRISVARLAKDSLSCARVPLRIKTIALRHARGRKIIMAGHQVVRLGIGLIGPGLIGRELLSQLRAQAPVLASERNLDLALLGVARSQRMVVSDTPIPYDEWEERLGASTTASDIHAFAHEVVRASRALSLHPVIVDCTAGSEAPSRYLEWMRAGVHVVTPNKRFNTGPIQDYLTARQLMRTGGALYFYEATCGAGLPIMSTLKHLQATGDRVLRIEGVLSGTLSFLFNIFGKESKSWSECVSRARAEGYTEPDPRDDLSGTDVARKAVILARECGLTTELRDVHVQSLVPESLASCSVDEFMRQLPSLDVVMAARHQEAKESRESLRYVAVVDVEAQSCEVVLRKYPADHPFSALQGSDNVVEITTTRYATRPLVIQGPGAGAAVTAGGVFSDFLCVAAHLGAGAY